MLSKNNIYRTSIRTQSKILQEQNNFRYIAAINIKIIKRNRAIISYTPKKFSTLLRKSFAVLGFCGYPSLPSGIPVMHTIHDPRKTVMNPHNRVGIKEYIIHYINKSFSLTWPLGRIQMPRRASSLNIAAVTQIASVARVMPLPYRRLTRRRILVCTGVVKLLTIIFVVFIIWPS
jgi:hypothetical protein